MACSHRPCTARQVRGRGPRELLQQEDEGGVGPPGACSCSAISQVRLLHRQASSSAPSSSARDVAQRRGRQLGVQQPAVAGHAAAGRCRPARPPRRPARAAIASSFGAEAEVPRRAGRVHGDGADPAASRSAARAAGRAPRRSSRGPRSGRSARARSSSRCSATSCTRPWAQELASITTGSAPPSLQRHSASAVARAIARGRRAVALRAPRRGAAVAARRRPGSTAARPARAETATSASGSVGCARRAARVAEDPVDARRQVDRGRAGARGVSGSCAGAGGGIAAGQVGTSSASRARRTSVGTAATARSPAHARPPRAGAQAGPRGALDGRPKRRATASAARSSRSVRSRAAEPFISLPVSIATGQAGMHVPSAAQVCDRVVLEVAQQRLVAPASPRAGAPARGAAGSAGAAWSSRCGSGRPARRTRTRRSGAASSSIGGCVFRSRRCTLGLAVEDRRPGSARRAGRPAP